MRTYLSTSPAVNITLPIVQWKLVRVQRPLTAEWHHSNCLSRGLWQAHYFQSTVTYHLALINSPASEQWVLHPSSIQFWIIHRVKHPLHEDSFDAIKPSRKYGTWINESESLFHMLKAFNALWWSDGSRVLPNDSVVFQRPQRPCQAAECIKNVKNVVYRRLYKLFKDRTLLKTSLILSDRLTEWGWTQCQADVCVLEYVNVFRNKYIVWWANEKNISIFHWKENKSEEAVRERFQYFTALWWEQEQAPKRWGATVTKTHEDL